MNKKCVFVSLMACTLILSACFSPWKGDEGTFTISIGGGNSGGRSSSNNSAVDSEGGSDGTIPQEIINALVHEITVSGGAKQEQTVILSPGVTQASFTVAPGYWKISVRAYLDQEEFLKFFQLNNNNNIPDNQGTLRYNEQIYYLFATSIPARVDIKPGKNEPVGIIMKVVDFGGTEPSEPPAGNTFTLTVGVITGQNGSWNSDTVYGTVEITSTNPDLLSESNLSKGEHSSYTMSNIPSGTTVTIKAAAGYNYTFVKWVTTDDINAEAYQVDSKDAQSSITIIITKNTTLYAVFNGNGAETPKNITSVEELAKIGGKDEINYPISGNYALMTDLDFNTLTDKWTPIGNVENPFTGTFDGRGHTIDLDKDKVAFIGTEKEETFYAGLFAVIGGNGEVKNLKLQGSVTINDNDKTNTYVGAVVGYNYGTIQNIVSKVNIEVTVTGQTGDVGGIAGLNEFHIKNCYSTGNITAQGNAGNAGGIVGSNYENGAIEYCWASGEIQGKATAGGIAGYFQYDSQNKTSNCVALNDKITATKAARIGWDDGGGTTPNVPILSNNYANSAMIVNGTTIASVDSGKETIHGADLSIKNPSDLLNFITTSDWITNSPASEESPWVWDTANSRPKLWFE